MIFGPPNAKAIREASAYGLVPATTAGNTVIPSPAPGILCKVIVTSAGTGTGSVNIYDNATTASGNLIAAIPATVAVGTVYSFNVPLTAGIVVAQVLNGPGLTVTYL